MEAEVGVVEVWEILGVKFAAHGVVSRERRAEFSSLGEKAAALDFRFGGGKFLHQKYRCIPVLPESFPAAIALDAVPPAERKSHTAKVSAKSSSG